MMHGRTNLKSENYTLCFLSQILMTNSFFFHKSNFGYDPIRPGLKLLLNLRLKLIRSLSVLLFLTLFNIQNTFFSSSASNYQ